MNVVYIAKNPSFFGRSRQEDFKTFYTKPQKVIVRDLPPHPLKEVVSVGNYKLREEISDEYLETGRSFNYSFTVYGEGNISSITRPEPESDNIFEIYPPNIRQNINRGNSRVTGDKSFNYYIIPNEPGEFELSDYFSWIYFNPVLNTYDTLTSSTNTPSPAFVLK